MSDSLAGYDAKFSATLFQSSENSPTMFRGEKMTPDYCDLCEQRFKTGEEYSEFNGVATHRDCLEKLVLRFAKPVRSYNFFDSKKYMIIRDPAYTREGGPNPKLLFSAGSARHAASNMARKEKVPFFVMQIVEVFAPASFVDTNFADRSKFEGPAQGVEHG